jgi:hypothetical protein
MSIGGLIIGALLVTGVALYVFLPLLRSQTVSEAAFQDKQRERALAYYERVLTNIRDLDDDYATGKISEGDYQQERERWMQRGIQVLKLLDTLDHDENILSDRQADAAEIDAAIEDRLSRPQQAGVSG